MTSPSPYLIRPALPEEAPVLIDFQIRMGRETEGVELDPQVLTPGVQAVFDDPRKGQYWVAVLEAGGVAVLEAGGVAVPEAGGVAVPPAGAGRIVGCLLTTPEWSDWRNGTILWVQSVYVLPEERGRGVFRSLYATLKRQVESSPELAGIRLYVERRNEAAQRLYERLGMTREHYYLYEWLKP